MAKNKNKKKAPQAKNKPAPTSAAAQNNEAKNEKTEGAKN